MFIEGESFAESCDLEKKIESEKKIIILNVTTLNFAGWIGTFMQKKANDTWIVVADQLKSFVIMKEGLEFNFFQE